MASTEVLLTYKRKRFRSARCPIDSASVVANQLGESAEGNNLESCTNGPEPASEENKLCSSIIKLQHSLLSSPKANIEEDKSNHVHDSCRLTCDSSEVLDGSPVEDRNKKASCDPVFLDGKRMANGIKGGSCVYLSPCFSSLQKSGETAEMMCSEGIDSTVEGMPVDMALKDKVNLPLITFRRRSKQKRDSQTLENDSSLPVRDNCLLATTNCGSAGSVIACDATASKSCSVDASENPNFPKMNLKNGSAFTLSQENDSSLPVRDNCLLATTNYGSAGSVIACDATASKSCSVDASENPFSKMNLKNGSAFTLSQEKKVAGEVDSSCGCSCSTFETGSVNPVYGTLGNLRAGQSHVGGRGSSQDSGPAFSSLQAKNSVDFQETPSVEKSPGLSNNDTNPLGKADEILSNKSDEAMLDLSICPPAKVDCKKTLEQVHGLPIIGSLPPSVSGNLNAAIPGVSIRDCDLELLHEKPEKGNCIYRHGNHCSSVETIVQRNNNQVNFAPAMALKHSCLQLFPENVSDHPRNSWQEAATHSVFEERPVNLLQSRTQAKTTMPTSSHFVGLPMEPRLKKYACSSSLPSWQGVGIQSTGFIPEKKLQYFPDQSSSFTRQQMILDKIATRSITLKGIRSSYVERYETPMPWSEEELDCLWIGVRRYGRGNWDSMLRDPRLHFLPWRTPAEVAVQWEVEQSKLFNHKPFSQLRHLKAPNVFHNCSDCYMHSRTGKQNSVDEVQLSLGDVYTAEPKDSSLLKRMNYLNAQNDGPRRVQESVADLNTMYLSLANQRRTMRELHAAGAVESSHNVHPDIFKAMDSSFPHWLKEAGVPPRTTVPSSTSHGDIRRVSQSQCCLNSSGESINAPNMNNLYPPVPVQVQVPDRNTADRSNVGHPGNCQRAAGHEKVEVNQPNMNKQELITINSDASSEETISDDLSGKP